MSKMNTKAYSSYKKEHIGAYGVSTTKTISTTIIRDGKKTPRIKIMGRQLCLPRIIGDEPDDISYWLLDIDNNELVKTDCENFEGFRKMAKEVGDEYLERYMAKLREAK